MEIERRKRNLVFTDETFTLERRLQTRRVSGVSKADAASSSEAGRRVLKTLWRGFPSSVGLSLSLSLSLFCPSFFRSSTIRSAATPAIWLRTFVVFGFWVPDATAVQVFRSFGPDLSLNAERRYQRFGISSSSFRREWLLWVRDRVLQRYWSSFLFVLSSVGIVFFFFLLFPSSFVPCRW
jgi:hypothetical protein